MGSTEIDRHDHTGWTHLMYAARDGHSGFVQLLLNEGASVSAAGTTDLTPVLISAYHGHLEVTKILVKAGADIEATNSTGHTSLNIAAQGGHSEVVRELIAAGAKLDSRRKNGATPLFTAAYIGSVDAVRQLLCAGANALLNSQDSAGKALVPLDVAAQCGHSEVVRELIQQRGISGCSGGGGGSHSLLIAAVFQHMDVLAVLTDARVADLGEALLRAIAGGCVASVMFLLRNQAVIPWAESAYVNQTRNRAGGTPLSLCLEVCRSSSPRITRWLIDYGADTTSVVPVTNMKGDTEFFGTPLTITMQCLREKRVPGEPASKEKLQTLEAIRRLLLQVEAVHAVSWLWCSSASSTPCVAEYCRPTTKISTKTPLISPSRTWRRRRVRGGLLAGLLRYPGKTKP